MPITRRKIVTALSALYLVLLTLLSAYSCHKTRILSLPLPTTLTAFTLALPLVTGLTISTLTTVPYSRPLLNSRSHTTTDQPQPRWADLALLALTILTTVLATLTGTYLPTSDAQTCKLDMKWRSMFRSHNGKAIQNIQDAFECCGLHSPADMAFPFPSKNIGAHACEKTFGREKSCFGERRGEERRVGGLMLVVIFGVVIWEFLVLLFFKSGGDAWWSGAVEEDHDTENQVNGRRVLSLGDGGVRCRYLDQPPPADEEEIDESQDGRDEEPTVIESRVQTSQLRDESEQWASEPRS